MRHKTTVKHQFWDLQRGQRKATNNRISNLRNAAKYYSCVLMCISLFGRKSNMLFHPGNNVLEETSNEI